MYHHRIHKHLDYVDKLRESLDATDGTPAFDIVKPKHMRSTTFKSRIARLVHHEREAYQYFLSGLKKLPRP
jgi:hypothetical protein